MEPPSTPPTARTRLGRPHTPPTPMHGPMHDEWSPHSPRRSNRASLQSNPYSSGNMNNNGTSNGVPPLQRTLAKPPAFKLGVSSILSPPSSPMRSGAGPGTRTAYNSKHVTIDDKIDQFHLPRKNNAMLPTPSKTPTMTPARKHSRAASMQDTARILHFQPDDPNDVMPTRRETRIMRLGNKPGFDLDADDYDEPMKTTDGGNFQIYTESHARVPEFDDSKDNIFYGPRASITPEPESPELRPVKSSDQISAERAMVAAAARNEGIIYIFRGKMVFQRFADAELPPVGADDPGATSQQKAIKRSVGAAAHVPITRSRISGRLLFPKPISHDTDDEEAETDIDVEMADAPGQLQHEPPLMSLPPASRVFKKKGAEVAIFVDDSEPTETPQRSAGIEPETPQRSSRKKAQKTSMIPSPQSSSRRKVQLNDVPIYEDDSLEPAPTPARTRTTRRKHAATQLTPVIEEESADEARGTPGPSSGRSRKSGGPSDRWPYNKKREGHKLESVVGKRITRSTNRSTTPT